ncbi:hypothetical protein M408DRAFT_23997 [Serendipita vermifera MAFF 305830]|uniref:Protein kinase domain-containing protein n=1 Tax=Serendipita vermifera MAFF 305830 TaxID=933852 RepID=A0A0C3BA06_SERVB|nr:hypothetical protein M408DRAFT_23997 [Serendipita vermifera MAFF 305830]
MSSVDPPSQVQDLTGQIWIADPIPVFSGNYSSVHLGYVKGFSSPIAIKIIKAIGDYDTVKRKLLREVTVWSTANHRNIYPFYGSANDRAFGPFGALISPWARNGDAGKLMSERGQNLIVAKRVELWKGVIDGVAYLHSLNRPIIHGDLKPTILGSQGYATLALRYSDVKI